MIIVGSATLRRAVAGLGCAVATAAAQAPTMGSGGAAVAQRGAQGEPRCDVALRAMRLEPSPPDAGGDAEDDLRVLQLIGCLRTIPLSIRPLTPTLAASLSQGGQRSPYELRWSATRLTVWMNSDRAMPDGQQGVWAGRGWTTALSAGVFMRARVFSMSLRPFAFSSENRDFIPVTLTPRPPGDFRDPFAPTEIDRPYRFGGRAYSRLDAGESWARADAQGVGIGFSNAAQMWGPARFAPLVLGSNGGGFPHVFMETTGPVHIGVGSLHVRNLIGRIESSGYEPPHDGGASRLVNGIVAVFTPVGLSGFEIGGTRFFHRRWPAGGVTTRSLRLPFEGLFRQRITVRDTGGPEADNQLASVFFRVAPPRAGMEVYGEFMRDDRSRDTRDFAAELAHASAHALGFRKTWGFEKAAGYSVTGEFVDARNPDDLLFHRPPASIYTSVRITEGHTNRGLLLGSLDAFGGAGSRILFESYRPNYRFSFGVAKTKVAHNSATGSWNGTWLDEYTVKAGLVRNLRSWASSLELARESDWSKSASRSRGNWTLRSSNVLRGSGVRDMSRGGPKARP